MKTAATLKPEHEARIRLWLKALRSGTYKQGRSRLRRGDMFCCLGVACDVYRKTTGKGTWFAYAEGRGMYEFRATRRTPNIQSLSLPAIVSKWFGFGGDDDPMLIDATMTKEATTCSTANDRGARFKKIADRIERRYLKRKAK